MKKHLFFLILLTVSFMFREPLSAEGLSLFHDRNLAELVLIYTDPEAGSFAFMDESGVVQYGIIGDLIGVEGLTVTEVLSIQIIAVSYEEYDWYGTTRTRTNTINIPKARIIKGGKGVR